MSTSIPANSNELVHDFLLPFLVDRVHIHGNLIRLNTSLDNIISGHQYPEAISYLLAEMLISAAAIGNSIKEQGLLSIQIQGDGPLSFISADFKTEGHIRGYAKIKDFEFFKNKNYTDLTLKDIFNKGFLMVTYFSDQDVNKKSQGIVEIENKNFIETFADYFHKSEQLDVTLKVVVNKQKNINNNLEWFAQSIMIKRLPPKFSSTNEDIANHEENWSHANILLNTISKNELLDNTNSAHSLLYRLYHEDDIKVFIAKNIKAICRCSKEKMFDILKSMSEKARDELKINGILNIKCQFCNKEENFTDEDFN